MLALSPALTKDSSSSEYVTLSLVSENKTLNQDSKVWIGLRAQLKPGWKAYWRSPGVAGYGARLNWDGLKNVKSAQVHWPIPHRFHTDFGMVNVYEGDFVLPISLEVLDLSKPVQGEVKADLLVCDKSLCVPVQQTLRLNLPPGAGEKNTAQALQILKALGQGPSPENNTVLKVEGAEISGNDIPPTIRVHLTKPDGFDPAQLPELFMEIDKYFLDAPLASLSNDHKTIVYSALVFPNENKIPSPIPNLVGKSIRLTVGLENQGKVFGFETKTILQTQSLTFSLYAGILLIAFLGGLILNIMPCVLPVLSLKVLSVMRQGGRDNKLVRREFMATVLGIIFSFLVLACVELFLKASGHALGWGVQFQQPVFVIGLVCMLTIFAASLFGFFEFRLPNFLSSIGGVKPHQESLAGSFLEGSLVTILATPCTAPLVGTALAFSLSRGSFEIISIFCTMGLGLAFPFLLLALYPSFAAKLPKPGAWMIRVKVTLGFLLILTSIWLLFVLKGQIGMNSTILVTTLMALVLILLSNAHFKIEKAKKLTWMLVSGLIIGSLFLSTLSRQTKPKLTLNEKTLWQPFHPDKIPEYVKANKIVFVNVTADWCLTCQVNKFFALKNASVIEELSKNDVITMEADWTNHNIEITSYLESFNQYGIPFYAVYGCKNRTGTFLGQILTPQIIIDAIKAERCENQLN
jgi:suppressor for copper-sensitivity B